MVLVDIQNYSFQYIISDQPTLKNINLQLEEGKFYALIGANGAGKSTLANAIRGFVPKFHIGDEAGDLFVFNQNMKDLDLSDLADRIGLVFQNPFTQISGGKKTVFDELAFGLENLGVEKEEIIQRVNETLKEAHIDHLRDKNPLELSGGQQQRVALASVLVMDQDLLIIDEPTSQLDPQSTDQIFEIIANLKGRGKTVLLIEHKIDQVAKFADEVIVMDQGRVVLKGEPYDVFQSSEYAAIDGPLPTASQISLDLYDQGISFTDVPVTLEDLSQQLVQYGRRQQHDSYLDE